MKYNIILACVIAAMILYIVFGHNGLLKYREMISIRESYEAKIQDMDKEIARLNRELDLAGKDREFLENIIRRELGLQKEGEDLYILENNDNATKK